jgi:hypothetical protein
VWSELVSDYVDDRFEGAESVRPELLLLTAAAMLDDVEGRYL